MSLLFNAEPKHRMGVIALALSAGPYFCGELSGDGIAYQCKEKACRIVRVRALVRPDRNGNGPRL